MATLNTGTPEYLTWKHEQIQVTILGGIRMEGLDRMRVTVKMEYKEQVIQYSFS